MSASKSLSDFFQNPADVHLGNCDKEAIHFSGQTQEGCALLAIDRDSGFLIATSENVAPFFLLKPQSLLGTHLRDLDPELARLVDQATDEVNMHEVLEYAFKKDGVSYDVVTHIQGQHRLIEFLPNQSLTPQAARTNMRICSKSCARILNAKDMAEAHQIAADATRQITGFSRVNIYRFLPDWSGEVLAESRDGQELASYLGLHFPTSDIPAQAHEMMKLVRYRAIGDVNDNNHAILSSLENGQLDLTWSVARSVSKMHTQYLRNMGVRATFNASLIHQDALWGLIAAHHTEPGLIPFDSWALMQEIGAALMLKHDQIERLESAEKVSELRKIENRFAEALRAQNDMEGVIKTLIPNLRSFLKADGFAFQYGKNTHVCGATPPANVIRDLTEWARGNHETADQFQTTALHREWPTGAAHKDTACGVLIQPIAVHRVCQLIWFRGPIARKVKWAGKPEKNKVKGRLTPRASFDVWVQEHSDEALPWQEADLSSAREVFTEFLDILASQLLLKEENAYLRQFAASAVHDIKAPLRGISTALEIMREEDFEADVVKETHMIAEGSAKRLLKLSSGLLELTAVSNSKLDFKPTQLQAVIEDACSLLAHDIDQTGAKIQIAVPGVIQANGQLLLRLFLNLIQNALKYHDPARALAISIDVAEQTDSYLEIAVSDTGVGISQKYAERVFKPLMRLHSQCDIEGSGLGLPICARIAEAHDGKIYLDDAYSDGARFLIRLSSPPGSAVLH
ncbi:MAG: ATP-binding protein [Paracoccaceae bacterium]